MATYKLNMIPGGAKVVVPVSQYDTGYAINFELYNGNTAFSLQGCTARIDIGKPDLVIYSSGDSVSLSGNTVTVILEEQMTAAWGPCIAEIVVTTSSGRHATANFILDVEKSPIEDGAESESIVNYVEANRERAVKATQAAEAAIEAARNAADAATQAAESALSMVANIESMPDALSSLASALAAPGEAAMFLGYDSERDAIAIDAGFVTPQMFGARGNGISDDTAAFQDALASGEKVVIPEGTYSLDEILWSDDSVIISDSGTYPDKRLVVSRNLRNDAPIERLIGQFNATELHEEGLSGYDYRLQAGCYDSRNHRIVLSFCTAYTTDPVTHETSDTDLVLTCIEISNGVIKPAVFAIDDIVGENNEVYVDPRNGEIATAVIQGGGHGNSICYNRRTNRIYSITGNGDPTHQIAVINADTLEQDETTPWLNPITDGSRPWQMAYDEVNDIFWIESNPGNGPVFKAYALSNNGTSLNLITGAPVISFALDDIREFAGMHYADDVLKTQATTVMNEQLVQVHYSPRSGSTPFASNGAFLTQYNYDDGTPKKVYRVPGYYGQDEPQCLVNADGKIFFFTDIGKDGYHYVSVSQLVFEQRVSGRSESPWTDMRVLASRNYCTDLNDVLGLGVYYSGSGHYTIAWIENGVEVSEEHQFANCPYNGAFTLWVLPFAGNESRLQILVGANAEAYIRTYRPNNNAWYGWKKITTSNVTIS